MRTAVGETKAAVPSGLLISFFILTRHCVPGFHVPPLRGCVAVSCAFWLGFYSDYPSTGRLSQDCLPPLHLLTPASTLFPYP